MEEADCAIALAAATLSRHSIDCCCCCCCCGRLAKAALLSEVEDRLADGERRASFVCALVAHKGTSVRDPVSQSN